MQANVGDKVVKCRPRGRRTGKQRTRVEQTQDRKGIRQEQDKTAESGRTKGRRKRGIQDRRKAIHKTGMTGGRQMTGEMERTGGM